MNKKGENKEEKLGEKEMKKELEIKVPETKTTELKDISEVDVSVPSEMMRAKRKKRKVEKKKQKKKVTNNFIVLFKVAN